MNVPFQKGDILVFKGEGDLLGKAICWLTNSDVTHAAMVYGEDSIVEMTGYGIAKDEVKISEGNDAYIMRLTQERSPNPLISAADVYLNGNVPYDYCGLLLLGGLLLIRKIFPSSRLLSAINRFLEYCCLIIDDLIKKLCHSEMAMVCSQLVYQIYYDCGKDYLIEIRNGNFSSGSLGTEHPDAIRLIDLIDENASDSFFPDASQNIQELPDTQDDLIEELLEAFKESEELINTNQFVPLDENTLAGTKDLPQKFLCGLKKLLKASGSDLPLDAMFVTPADLAYHAENLKNVGTLSLERVHKK